ncbi:MAG TPA: ABC transporter permease [Dehalococcoidia bacterium]|nr:ABC transporter permease [Dehalococcoidia bacterium]
MRRIVGGRRARLRNFLLLLAFPVVWPVNILTSLIALSGRHSYVLLGILSLALLVSGIVTETGASFFIGLTGSVLAVGLFVRFIASRFLNDSESVNQLGGTFEGGLVLLANSLPFDFFEVWTGELSEPGPWFWPVGGAISTAAAVWLLMSNTKILIAILNLMLSRFSGLRAVTKTAISYPMAAKFRTGLTVAMFALIIFTLMIFSVLNGIGDITSEQPERVTGGFDIKSSINRELPIVGDIRDSLNMSDFTVVAGASNIPIEVREFEGENNTFKTSKLVSLENGFFETTKWRMAYFDPKYGSTDEEIWGKLLENPDLVVANYSVIPSGDPFGPPDRSFKTSYLNPGDLIEMESFAVEIKERKTAVEPSRLTVIGIVERLASGRGWDADSATFYSSRSLASKITKENIPLDVFYFSLKNKDDVSNYTQKLEKIFLANSMDAENLLQRLEDENATGDAFNKLFQGFSGLGLVVGVAAIGVLSVRAVVERRQSIGVLRAIGFRSSMIRAQFLIESSFITLLGIVVGIFLGILQSWLIFLEISKELEGAKFVVPIADVGVLIGVTILASILASVIPANAASKTYPAEALRYE